MDNEKLKAKELNDSELNEVTGGSGLEMETYQEYCRECGYVFREEKCAKGFMHIGLNHARQFCPQCQKYVEVGARTF